MTRYVPPTDGTFDVPIVRSEEAPATSNEDARLEKAGVSPPIVYHLDPKDHDFVENYHKALLDKLASCGGKRSAGAVSRAAAQVQLHLEDGETAAGGDRWWLRHPTSPEHCSAARGGSAKSILPRRDRDRPGPWEAGHQAHQSWVSARRPRHLDA